MQRETTVALMASLIALMGMVFVPPAMASQAIAHGSIVTFQAPEFAYPGQRLWFYVVAVNDGGAPGYFDICHDHFNDINKYYHPERAGQSETAVHCSGSEYLMPGETITYDWNRYLMQSVPVSRFSVELYVQQVHPVLIIDEYGYADILNLSVDAQVGWNVTNLVWVG